MGFFTGAICNKCGDTLSYFGIRGKVRTTELIREKGWSVSKEADTDLDITLCPKCRKRKRKK